MATAYNSAEKISDLPAEKKELQKSKERKEKVSFQMTISMVKHS